MTYIFCAFEAEARAIIDYLHLKKKETMPFKTFSNSDIQLMICGMGQENALHTATYLLENISIDPKRDSLINIGICAAKNDFSIGDLVLVNQLCDEKRCFFLSPAALGHQEVSCFSAKAPLDQPCREDIAEMEAMSIYQSLHHIFNPSKVAFLKVVSDHFTPFKPKKQEIITLMHSRLKEIINTISLLQGEPYVH